VETLHNGCMAVQVRERGLGLLRPR